MVGPKLKRQQTEISEVVGTNLKRIRQLSGISQEILGSRLGLTFQQVQKYEKGSNRISAPVLVQLASIFDVDIAEFFAGCQPDGHIKGVSSSPIPNVSQRTIELAVKLNDLPPGKIRDGLFNLIDGLPKP